MNDTFSISQKNTIWKNYFGTITNRGFDVFGRRISKENFEADHIYPVAEGGKTVVTNGMPLHYISNYEKADDMYGSTNGKTFRVQGTPTHGILSVDGIAYDYKGKR